MQQHKSGFLGTYKDITITSTLEVFAGGCLCQYQKRNVCKSENKKNEEEAHMLLGANEDGYAFLQNDASLEGQDPESQDSEGVGAGTRKPRQRK